jgi:hypothetical protein
VPALGFADCAVEVVGVLGGMDGFAVIFGLGFGGGESSSSDWGASSRSSGVSCTTGLAFTFALEPSNAY